VAEATLAAAAASAALPVAALWRGQPFTVAAFEERQLSGVHTLAASADQVSRLESIMPDLECQL
jgi:hypothetical protein